MSGKVCPKGHVYAIYFLDGCPVCKLKAEAQAMIDEPPPPARIFTVTIPAKALVTSANNVTPATKVARGRPRRYETNAARQAAYRSRH